jgi:uncharacterized protein YaeQ
MALSATIYRVRLQLADLDRSVFEQYQLTLARHPSETAERLVVRLLAFALNADAGLVFCRGLSNDDEPALWQLELDGRLRHWIDVGQPDPARLRRACGRAERVTVYVYGGRAAEQWWQQHRQALAGLERLRVCAFPAASIQQLGAMAERSMEATCTIQEDRLWFDSGGTTVELLPEIWQTTAQ